MATYNENSKVSGNATAGRTLKRMKLSYDGTEVKFAVNPEDYTQTEPNKASITQTKGGAWIDAWGGGIRELTIKGTTGVKGGTKSIDEGYNRWKTLRNLFRQVYDAVQDGEEVKELIKFYNFTDNEYFYCYPAQQGIELYRSKSRPHIYQYTIHLWVIRKIGEAVTTTGTIGNPNKSTSGGSSSKTTKSTTITKKSGDTYRTRSRSNMSESDSTTVTNTKTKTLMDIQEDCKLYYTALEPLVGGRGGKISPVTGFGCCQGIIMQAAGTISNVNGFTGVDIAPKQEIYDTLPLLLSEVKYTSRVSPETYEMYAGMKEYSPDYLSPAYSLIVGISPKQKVMQAVAASTVYDSTLYELILSFLSKSTLTKTESNQLKVILLESMMIYMEMYKLYNQAGELVTPVTVTYIEILISNIRAMIMYFTLKSTDYNKYDRMDISSELRNLEKIMTQIKVDVIDYL